MSAIIPTLSAIIPTCSVAGRYGAITLQTGRCELFKQLNEIKFLWRNNSARVIVHPTLLALLEH
jgi:hypothetical protein